MHGKAQFLCVMTFGLWASLACAQEAQQLVQQVVDSERTANHNDHSQWLYLDESRKPKEHLIQWVASTPQGSVRRVLEKDGRELTESQQRELIQQFLHDTKAQKKEVAEANHDAQQIDDFLKLLPIGFVWTKTGETEATTTLHFEPSPTFHPPTREAHVFSSMRGDLVADRQQRRIRSMRGQLIHDVNFGGGLLGKLKEGSSFALEQAQVAPTFWQLTAIHVHLEGNALLFKSVSLQQDDERSRFQQESPTLTLDQAASSIMNLQASIQP